MKNSRETVTLSDGSEVVVCVPSPQQQIESRKVFNVKWKEYVNSGIMTNKELNDFLLQKGILNNAERDKKLEVLQNEIIDNCRKLKSGKKGFKTVSDAKKAAIKTRENRLEMLRILSEANEFAQKTAEAMAEQDRFNYLVTVCAYKDDSLYFEDVEDYLNKSDEVDSLKVATAFATLTTSYSDVNLKTEEDKFLYQYGFINEKGHLINKDGKLIDEDGRLVDENGRFIDSAGKYVDINGNPIDDDGNPVVDFEDFLDESGEVIERKNLPA